MVCQLDKNHFIETVKYLRNILFQIFKNIIFQDNPLFFFSKIHVVCHRVEKARCFAVEPEPSESPLLQAPLW